jgi:hypothetical protein
MTVPSSNQVDFRAACFCHKNVVDVGFVCSVCLSSECHHDYLFGGGLMGYQSSVSPLQCAPLASAWFESLSLVLAHLLRTKFPFQSIASLKKLGPMSVFNRTPDVPAGELPGTPRAMP